MAGRREGGHPFEYLRVNKGRPYERARPHRREGGAG